MAQLKFLLQAAYEDGHLYTSPSDDVSIKDAARNAFYDIKTMFETGEHGKMVRFSLLCTEPNVDGQYQTFDIDWTKIPSNAKPIYYIKNERTHNYDAATNEVGDLVEHKRTFGFGYEFMTAEGKNEKEVVEVC